MPAVLFRGAVGRCPWCGRELVSLRRWFHLAETCPRCGLALEREAGAFLGSMVVSYTLTCVALVVVLGSWMVATLPDLPVMPMIAVGLAIVVGLPLLTYPFSKTFWVAVDLLLHRMDRADRDRFASEFTREDEGR